MYRAVALGIIMVLAGCSSGGDDSTDSTTLVTDDPSNTVNGDNPVEDSGVIAVIEPSNELEEQTVESEEQPVEITESPAEVEEINVAFADEPSEVEETIDEVADQPSEVEETTDEIADQPTEAEELPEEIAEAAAPFQIDEAVPAVLESLVGYQSDQLAILADGLSSEAINGASDSGESLSDGEFTTEDNRFGTVTTPIQRVRYNCSGGGTVVRETGRLRLDDIDYTRVRSVDGYEFDQCVFTNQTAPLTAGDYTATGHLVIDTQSTSGPRFGNGDESFAWEQFNLQGPEGVGYELNGTSSNRSLSGAFADSFVSREADFDLYRKRDGDAIVESLVDSFYRQIMVGSQAGVFNSVEIELAGTVTGTNTESNIVLVQTDTLLEHTAAPFFPENFQPFTGQLSLTSSDGGFVTLLATPSLNNFSVFDNLALNWSGALSDGTLISRSNVLLDEYSARAPNCSFSRADDSEPFTCTEEGEQFVVP